MGGERSNPKTTRFRPRSWNELTKGGRQKDAKESYQPPALIFPEKHNWSNGGLLIFLSQKSLKQLQAQDQRQSAPRSFCFQLVPFSVPALIFQPIKLRQESFAERRSAGRNGSSHWANIEIGGSHQNLINLVWCLGGSALVTEGIQSAKQNEPSVFFFPESDCHRASDLFYKQQPTQWNWYRLRTHLHIVHRNTANSPRNMLKAKQALFPPACSNDCLPFPLAVAMATQIHFYERSNIRWLDEFLLYGF